MIDVKKDNMDNIWYHDVKSFCDKIYTQDVSHKLFSKFDNVFSQDYKYKTSPEFAAHDLFLLNKVADCNQNQCDLSFEDSEIILKIVSVSQRLSLSYIMPFVEALGFYVIEDRVFMIDLTNNEQLWLHKYRLSIAYINNIVPDYNKIHLIKANVEHILTLMMAGDMPVDDLCQLVTLENMQAREILLVRALTGYIRQTNFHYASQYVSDVLIKYSNFAANIIRFFDCKFDPAKRECDSVEYLRVLNKYLNDVENAAEDKVLRVMMDLVNSILRTNFYQKNQHQLSKNYISFKVRSVQAPYLPLPLPYAEIYVYSADFEGIHLRGGKIARGGIRWSDRHEDYRTEVLGLMKAQMTKNPVIVPVGSKGGFIVKFSKDNLNNEQYQSRVIECYKLFLSGLLDLTDNIVDSKIVHPQDVVRLDDDDTYLVVAADKGTATFSDHANAVSKQYNFG